MKEFYIIKDDVQVGPFSPEQLKKMLERGTINNTTLARSADAEQSVQWKKISDLSLNPGESKKVYAKLLSYENGVMRLACPSCNQHYSVSEELFYVESFECNKCKERFRLPPRPNATSEFVNGISHPDFNEEVPDGDLLCPHCWKSFDHDYILYISVHPSLFGDPILGDYVPKRFVPTVFNQMGQPLDECGLPATEMPSQDPFRVAGYTFTLLFHCGSHFKRKILLSHLPDTSAAQDSAGVFQYCLFRCRSQTE